jgi:hypothetical protein
MKRAMIAFAAMMTDDENRYVLGVEDIDTDRIEPPGKVITLSREEMAKVYPEGPNRHERRKAEALARRRWT